MEKKLDFKKVAREAVTLSRLMEGNDKISTEDIIAKYPDGFVIDNIDWVHMEDDSFWAYHIKDTKYFAFAGHVLGKIFDEFLKIMGGNYDALYEEFAQSGGIKVKLESSLTKDKKRTITTVTVLD